MQNQVPIVCNDVNDDELGHPICLESCLTPGRHLQPVHEVLLQAVCIFADRRNADVHITADMKTFSPVMQCLLACNGFMSSGSRVEHKKKPTLCV